MKIVSPLLKNLVYPVMHHAGWFGDGSERAHCAVVTYHGVIPDGYTSTDPLLDGNLVTADNLRRQLRFIKDYYNIIRPEDFLLWIREGQPLPVRPALITCDDGHLNAVTDMLPILRSEGVTCLYFVTSASCAETTGMLWLEELYHLLLSARSRGTDARIPQEFPLPPFTGDLHTWWWALLRWASSLGITARQRWMNSLRSWYGPLKLDCERRWRLLNISELKELIAAGMSVGSHAVSHTILSECADDEARFEIETSKLELERALGQRVWALAYPFGTPATLGTRELNLAQEAGFACAFMNIEDDLGDSYPFRIPRTHVTSTMSVPELEAHLSGFHSRLQHVVRG